MKIRDLLWFVVLVALSFGWWTDHRQQRQAAAMQIDALREENSKLASRLTFFESFDPLPRTPPGTGFFK